MHSFQKRLPLFALAFAGAHAAALMPAPVKTVPGSGRLPVTASFRVSAADCHDARAEAGARRLEARIVQQSGFAIVSAPAPKPTVTVACATPDSADESYTLDIAADGARISAVSALGALHAMQTFAQSIEPTPDGFAAASVHIEDHPRFPWRGLMLDVSRHWMPLPVVLRNLDAMEAVKLNVFHWHLSDDQGFRVESRLYPRLHELGSDGHYYTQQEVRQVVAYAAARGIRVVPEFDIPGHTSSWFAAYPELASAPGPYSIERHWGIFEPAMDPSRESTYEFLDAFLGEMTALFPDPYFHVGGDEVEETQWKKSAAVQAFARAHNLATGVQIQTYFNQRVQTLLKKHGKIMIGWDEILAPGLASDSVIQSWRGAASLSAAARQGYRAILSSGYYLDHLQPASTHYAVDPLAGVPDAVADRILGGEACMWNEYATAETVDSRIWPRMAAIAERFWSPRDVTDVTSLYTRLETVSRELEWTGVQHRAGYAPMLDRISPSPALRTLADAVEALGIGTRSKARTYTSLIDMNRLVDAARPESESIRHLEQAARARDFAALRSAFTNWVAAPANLPTDNVFLVEAQPLARHLAETGSIGLRALEYLESGKAAPAGWIAQQRSLLDAAAKPEAEVALAAVRPVRLLLTALAGSAQ